MRNSSEKKIKGKKIQMSWQDELKNNITTADEMKEIFHFNEEETKIIGNVLQKYPMSITRYYLSLIDFNNPDDPIRKMVIPSEAELLLNGIEDTSGEDEHTKLCGLQHKYKMTVLILFSDQCAVYCRHCFRKRFVGRSNLKTTHDYDNIIEYIKSHKEINNILLSGGDVLLSDNEHLKEILWRFAGLPEIDAIRIATRVLVTFPDRILEDVELQEILKNVSEKKQIYMVTQFNHPNEITELSCRAVKKIINLGIVVLNQTVLLKGINDVSEVMGALIQQISKMGVRQYYVFQCRPTLGVKNQFQVPLKEGIKIVESARDMQNGLGKSFTFCLSHITGKIQILYCNSNKMVFKYHEAKNISDAGRIFEKEIDDNQSWLYEI